MTIMFIIFVSIAFVIMLLSIMLLYKFKAFYTRMLVAANIDTVSMIFFVTGVCFISPNAEFLLKTLLVLVVALITNPLSAHATARSAYISGYRPRNQKKD